MAKERQAGLDLVRAAAIFFVVCLHGITMRGALGVGNHAEIWSEDNWDKLEDELSDEALEATFSALGF